MIGILHVVWLLVGLTVEIDDAVLDLQRLSRQTHTTLHVVLATVGGTGDNITILREVGSNLGTTGGIDGLEIFQALFRAERIRVGTLRIELVAYTVAHLVEVVGLILGCRAKGIAGREVEHDDVVELHLAQALHATVVPMRPFDIRLALKDGHRVLCQRHGQRRLRNAGAIAHFRHKQVVTRQQRLLQ